MHYNADLRVLEIQVCSGNSLLFQDGGIEINHPSIHHWLSRTQGDESVGVDFSCLRSEGRVETPKKFSEGKHLKIKK